MGERLYFQFNGKSVTTDVDEVRALLGGCGEPLPTLPPIAILSGDQPELPEGTLVFRYPSQATLAAAEIGVELPESGSEGEPAVVRNLPLRPVSITATQIRLWLFRKGIDVSQAIQAIQDEKERGEAMILWEYAPYVDRDNPLVAAIANAIGMGPAEVDEAFAEAASL